MSLVKDIWYVYLIQSTTGRVYTGISPNPQKRLEAHNAGKGAKATRAGRPWELMYTEPHESKGKALKREAEIKKWRKNKKLALFETE